MEFLLFLIVSLFIKERGCYFREKFSKALRETGVEYDENCLKFLECHVGQEWDLFRQTYKRTYENCSTEEKKRRIFEESSIKVQNFRIQYFSLV